ncbi:hypothetical protein [Shewanella psychrotolerans]|uniref:hypothetical protein n=1 Tax=Shewanella psychrotolerans TaxID=2864206 RepID=UPI001C65ECBC|nr:hypothetical protein [Shewanella psychrotolerans]QYK01117.1 hypothetical protein K0I62_17370 [Shewanella psychrotolerans]
MRTILYAMLTTLLLVSYSSMAKVTHVSINQQQFALGANPKLKVNIVTERSHLDKLQFVVEQQSGSERLMVSPINSFMLLLDGVEDVTDADAMLIVKEYQINQWQEVKRMRLFDGATLTKPLATPLDKKLTKPTVVNDNLVSTAVNPTGVVTAKPLLDNNLIEPNCQLDYDGKQTLWRIASMYAKAWQLSTYGAALAIFDANPKAFSKRKIDKLRADVVLVCPSLLVKQRYLDAKFAKQTFDAM